MKGEKPGRLVETKLQLDFIAWQEGDVDADAGKEGRVPAAKISARKPMADGRLPPHRGGQYAG